MLGGIVVCGLVTDSFRTEVSLKAFVSIFLTIIGPDGLQLLSGLALRHSVEVSENVHDFILRFSFQEKYEHTPSFVVDKGDVVTITP